MRVCTEIQTHAPIIQSLNEQGKLTEAQTLILKETKPTEELYDLVNDPLELNNLADSPRHRQSLGKLRRLLDEWINDTGDMGLRQFNVTDKEG